ncbi:DUF1844 domain-containing protein [Haliangium sp.]|uniref:DUF1844 domain-containing protein n=1 Tax=Haliangium sp. TaxID=2663208 RepID=UPI003D14BFD2
MTQRDPSDNPTSSTDESEAGAEVESTQEEARSALPPMDFSTFVLSLGSSAMVNLGELPPLDGDEPICDLAAAKQIIDILGILEEKTRGNLDDSEEKLIQSLLYDLRVQYVDAQGK